MYFIYLRGIERRRNRQRQKGLPPASSLPQMPAMATTGLGQSQEPGTEPRSTVWGQAQLPGPSPLPRRRHISRKLELRVGAAAARTSSPLLLSSACLFLCCGRHFHRFEMLLSGATLHAVSGTANKRLALGSTKLSQCPSPWVAKSAEQLLPEGEQEAASLRSHALAKAESLDHRPQVLINLSCFKGGRFPDTSYVLRGS